VTKPQRAAIYVRISDDRQKDAAGVGRQETDARGLADRLGWQVGPVVVENDTSAYKRKKVALPNGRHELRVYRPGFRDLLDLIVTGAVDGMIAYDLDRTARDPRDLEDLIDAVEQCVPRLPVESVTGSLRLANDSDVTMARVMVAVANKSSRDSSRRIKRKHDELAEQGRYAGGGARRYGYERDGVTIKPNEARVIRFAARAVLAGCSVSRLARYLNHRGRPTVLAVDAPTRIAKLRATGRQADADRAKALVARLERHSGWSARALTDILRSPRVAGLRVHRGEVVGKAAWPAILDRETHEAVAATLHQRAKTTVQPRLIRWCNGLLFCGRCGHYMSGSYVSEKKPFRYWCPKNRGGCGRTAIQGPKTEAEIERQVLVYLTRPDVVARLSATRSTTGLERVRADVAEDEAQLRTLSRMWAEKQITLDEYAEARRIIEKRLQDARAVTMSAVPERVRRVLAADDVAAAWHALDPTGKREVVQAVLSSGGMKGWTVKPADTGRGPRFDPSRLELTEEESS
jgi:site-specific DNA recombinase